MSISRIVNEKKLNEALKRINIPEYSSSDANKVLSVNSTGDTLLWADTNGTLTSESFDNESVFFVGNMDTNIATDGLVVWLYKDIVQDRVLYDLSGNGNNVILNPGISITNESISINSDNGIVYSIIDIPETEIITMEYTAKITGNVITGNGATIITSYNYGKCGMKIGFSNDLYANASVVCESGSVGILTNKTTGPSNLHRIPGIVYNKPFHFLFRYNSELARVEIFVNGVNTDYYVDVSSVGAPKLTVSKLGFFTRGTEGNPVNHLKNFEVYDIKAYNKMLSDEEILINYNNLIKNGVVVNE